MKECFGKCFQCVWFPRHACSEWRRDEQEQFNYWRRYPDKFADEVLGGSLTISQRMLINTSMMPRVGTQTYTLGFRR